MSIKGYDKVIRKGIIKMRAAFVVILLLWLVAIGTVWAVCIWENRIVPKQDTDAIIVLGAQVLPNGQPNRILKTRLDMTLEAYSDSPRPVICCGARGDDEPKAEGIVMRDYLIARGVDYIDRNIVDGTVNGMSNAVIGSGDTVSRAQTGYVRDYAAVVVIGAIVLVAILFLTFYVGGI